MLVRNIRCGTCRKTLPTSTSYLDVVGPPFIECPHCRSINRHQEINEWDLKPFHHKFAFFFMAGFNAIVLGGLVGFLAGFGLVSALNLPNGRGKFLLALSVGALGVVVASIVLAKHYGRKIAESRVRMAEPDYRKKLHDLGFIKAASGG